MCRHMQHLAGSSQSPGAGGPLTGCPPRLKRLIHLSKVTRLTAKSQGSNPGPSDSRAQALNPTVHVPFPPPFPFPGTSAQNALKLWGKLRGELVFFFKQKLKKIQQPKVEGREGNGWWEVGWRKRKRMGAGEEGQGISGGRAEAGVGSGVEGISQEPCGRSQTWG